MLGAVKADACDVGLVLDKIKSGNICATIVNAESVFSYQQIEAARELAKKAMADGRAVSDNLAIEFMLWLSCETRVNNAIEKVGAKEGKEIIFVLLDGNEEEAKKAAEKVGLKIIGKSVGKENEGDGKIKSAIGKNGKGDEKIKLIIEKMALSRIQN